MTEDEPNIISNSHFKQKTFQNNNLFKYMHPSSRKSSFAPSRIGPHLHMPPKTLQSLPKSQRSHFSNESSAQRNEKQSKILKKAIEEDYMSNPQSVCQKNISKNNLFQKQHKNTSVISKRSLMPNKNQTIASKSKFQSFKNQSVSVVKRNDPQKNEQILQARNNNQKSKKKKETQEERENRLLGFQDPKIKRKEIKTLRFSEVFDRNNPQYLQMMEFLRKQDESKQRKRAIQREKAQKDNKRIQDITRFVNEKKREIRHSFGKRQRQALTQEEQQIVGLFPDIDMIGDWKYFVIDRECFGEVQFGECYGYNVEEVLCWPKQEYYEEVYKCLYLKKIVANDGKDELVVKNHSKDIEELKNRIQKYDQVKGITLVLINKKSLQDAQQQRELRMKQYLNKVRRTFGIEERSLLTEKQKEIVDLFPDIQLIGDFQSFEISPDRYMGLEFQCYGYLVKPIVCWPRDQNIVQAYSAGLLLKTISTYTGNYQDLKRQVDMYQRIIRPNILIIQKASTDQC